MKVGIGSIVILIIMGFSIMSCSTFGTRPNTKEKSSYKSSEHFNAEKNIFENRRPNLIAEMRKKNMSWKVIKQWFAGGINRVPAEPLPEVKSDLQYFLEASDELKVIWFGHSSFLLNMDGKIVLVDPVFGESAAPFSFMVKRFQKPVLSLEELPKIDYIVISHDHYDHLDMTSVKYFADKDITFVTPLGVGSHLKGWGVDENKIMEKDWWESIELGGVKFIATPAQHFSGRNGIHNNETLWASWVIQSKNHNVYFSGDTGYDTHFKDIGEKYGPFDVAFIESGQYNENWKEVHMMPEESITAYHDLKAKKFFPVHWGMFELSMHTWDDPIVQLTDLTKNTDVDILSPKIGEVLNISKENSFDQWWRSVKKVTSLSK